MRRGLAAVLSLLTGLALAAPAPASEPAPRPFARDPGVEARIDALLARMTLAEKVGQLRQGGYAVGFDVEQARSGIIGSITNPVDPYEIAKIQKAARESRLGIPILIANNVIHGFRTLFPVPLGLAATFDPDLVETASEWAGRESAAVGLHWTLAPMVDLSRDPRWGRVVEGPGEDPHLAGRMAAAQVRGFLKGGIMASLKHYAGYGAAEAGRDYNSTEIAPNTLRDLYLPPFRAGVEAGALSVMSAFNALNGTPATAHKGLIDGILKTEWRFDGFVISDWDSVWELINHGHAADFPDAARKAILAGLDVEMAGDMFKTSLAAEVEAGRVPLARLDEAVRRVLRVKVRMGLFDRPDPDPAAAAAKLFTPEAQATARAAAVGSMVLLKNRWDVLPIAPTVRRIAVVGSLADSPADHMGSWGADGRQDDAVPTLGALRARAGSAVEITYAPGCKPDCRTDEGFAEAVEAARRADLVVAVLGEPWWLTAEGTSRTRLGLPNRQQALLEAVAATGKPVVLVVLAGRPMAITWAAEHVDAILYAFSPGTMGGPAIADVLFGDAAPSGKLPMTMPRAVGQIPLYYNHLPTGRPPTGDHYSSKYIDEEVTPLYPFGFGLSYTTFAYADLKVPATVRPGDTLQVSVDVTNTGRRAGSEVVQLYVRDLVGTKSRPVKELKAFRKIALASGETRRVRLDVPVADLGFHLDDGRYVVEPGRFRIFVGGSSTATMSADFDLAAP
ncbi:glycoside hydrolase family 3 N-terminal domain-containing protein [Prosthecomicrobium sp. N25]|uniref:glycoside hydrolase family 3 N-terminal domain-containing protein n=1 Tax=Prosthecomicrobium sp. N25 TaxID=3129254 RepID=UPI0030780F28